MSAEAVRRRALAQVVSTLILLVVSILLSGVVVYYSVNIISTRIQTEEVRLGKQHVWVNSTGAVAALKVQNLGGRDILIDKLEVRGVEAAWSASTITGFPRAHSSLGTSTLLAIAT